MSFRSPYLTPTEEQYALLGRIVADWAVVENGISTALARLAMAPDFPALALTTGLNYHGMTRAVKQLLDLHEHRYHYQHISLDAVASGRAILKQISQWREMRNRTAHAVWLRIGDGAMFAFEPEAIHFTTAKSDNSRPINNEELKQLADATAPLIENIEAFVSMLPEIPEVQPQPSP